MNPKHKGNAQERKVAKELSMWIFEEKDVLRREPTSGADKIVYSGDVIPIKQIDWPFWPFIIEVKTGYKNHMPDFWNYSIIEKWYKKALGERVGKQEYVILVLQFYRRAALFVTDYCLNFKEIVPKLIIPIYVNKVGKYLFVYDYKKLLTKDFENAFNLDQIFEELD